MPLPGPPPHRRDQLSAHSKPRPASDTGARWQGQGGTAGAARVGGRQLGHLLQQGELPKVLAGAQDTEQLLLPIHPPAHPHLQHQDMGTG